LKKIAVVSKNPKELERLIGKWKNDFDKIKKAKKFATKYQLVLLIKGANSITVFENKLYVNTTGNPGLATAGSGDVLTGMITGLIAQGYNPLEASLMGVYLHGKAADIAVENLSYQALLASDVIDYIGDAYLDLFKQAEPAVVEEEGENEAQEEGGSN
jgi:NAD(P)H-hydrate repair Nnr-like enzyme with NAD(P)H-hydrate dehydratase domain